MRQFIIYVYPNVSDPAHLILAREDTPTSVINYSSLQPLKDLIAEIEGRIRAEEDNTCTCLVKSTCKVHPEHKIRSCNRHDDCDRANIDFKAKNGRPPGVNFHCHDDECEDCFGC